jgi:SAM-dependent methyltransferase
LEEFHHAVNVTFHEFESEVYDQVHSDMWQSLPRQFELLVDDWLAKTPSPRSGIRLLDIGAGTGLATDSILKTAIGPSIGSVDLLDTSPKMLRRALARAAQWKVPVAPHEGLLDSIDPNLRFDLIITSSVLHHVPDLPGFARSVSALQPQGGAFLHLQDPNGDSLQDPDLKQRMEQYSRDRLPSWLSRITPRRVLGRLYRQFSGSQEPDYLAKTNRALIEQGVVRTPLTPNELWAITDLHVEDGEGISITRLRGWMPEYELVSQRAYAFFGELASNLPPRLRKVEEEMIARRALNGLYIGAIWRKL